MKFWPTTLVEYVRKAESAYDAELLARQSKWRIRADWDQIKVQVMRDGLRAKFQQCVEAREALLATGNTRLVKYGSLSKFWGAGVNGSGKNMLGKLLMELRDELRNTRV